MAPEGIGPDAGLCASCTHVRRVSNRRGSSFFLCGQAAEDGSLARYPRLPVRACPAYAAEPHGQNPQEEKS